jgi:hypothetical protein
MELTPFANSRDDRRNPYRDRQGGADGGSFHHLESGRFQTVAVSLSVPAIWLQWSDTTSKLPPLLRLASL